MRSLLKRVARSCLPESLQARIRHHRSPIQWKGNYRTWADAARECQGYDDQAIMAAIVSAARDARDGRAAYERDGVTFSQPAEHPRLVALLRREAAISGGAFDVIDFGGSLGSLYFQHRRFLAEFPALRWKIVEQPAWVKVGQREFSDERLSFHQDVTGALQPKRPTALILSSVLSYLPEPHGRLADLLGCGFDAILVDRTGCIRGTGNDQLCIQHVALPAYRASYPCWFFDRSRLRQHFEKDYDTLTDVIDTDLPPPGREFRSFVFHKKRIQ